MTWRATSDHRGRLAGGAFAVMLMSVAPMAWAGGPTVTIDRPPCKIEITPVGPFFHGTNPAADGAPETEQSRADALKIKAALDKALDMSEDMRTKTDDACAKSNNNVIRILVFRDSTVVNSGQAHPDLDMIRIDLGDIETKRDNFHSSSQAAIDAVADASLTRTLAHEIDHLRHTAEDNHRDPHGEEAGLTTGPAVDDENKVIAQMDFPFHQRRFYGVVQDGKPLSAFSVDTDGDGSFDSSVLWFDVRPTRVTSKQGGSSYHLLHQHDDAVGVHAPPTPGRSPRQPSEVISVPEPVVPPSPPSGVTVEVFTEGAWGVLEAPSQPFLATETETAQLVLGAVRFNPDADLAGITGGARVLLPTVNATRPFLTGKLSYFAADDDASLGSIDTTDGLLGIPGTGDPDAAFSAGVALPGGIATDLRASFEQTGASGSAAIGLTVPLEGAEISPYLGFGFTEIDQQTMLRGTVEAYAIDFAYATEVEIERFSIDLGSSVEVLLSPAASPFSVSAYLQPTVHIDITSVSGMDRLSLSGLVSDEQSVALDENSTDVGVSVSAGVRWLPADFPLTFDLGATVTHRPGAVVVKRSGESGEASQADIGYSTIVVGTLRATFRF